jgi:GT2 family glycosyltransferase
VNWRRYEDTIACLKSLALMTNQIVFVSICENGSEDSSGDRLNRYLTNTLASDGIASSHPAYDIVEFRGRQSVSNWLVLSRKNLGFAGGNNLAFNVAQESKKFDYVWFLNNDTEVEPDCLERMVERMEADPTIGICGSTLVYAHDRRTVQCFGGCSANLWTGMTNEIGNGGVWPCDVDQSAVESTMDYVSGASMLVSSAFLEKVGLMTEDYFLFYEELDWAMRARRAGFRLGYAKDAVVYHKEGASIGTGKAAARSALAEFYGLRNKLLFTWRFVPWAFPSVWVVSWLQVGRRIVQGRFDRALLMARTLVGMGAAPSPK